MIGVINDSVDKNATVKRIEFVGPSVGSELAQTGGMALLVALICILIYVGFRFEWRLALGGGYRAGARRDHHAGRAVAVPHRD